MPKTTYIADLSQLDTEADQPEVKRTTATRQYSHAVVCRFPRRDNVQRDGALWGAVSFSSSEQLAAKEGRRWEKVYREVRVVPAVEQINDGRRASTRTRKEGTMARKTKKAATTQLTNSNARKEAARKAGKCQLCGTKTKGHSVVIDYDKEKVVKSAAGKAKAGHAFYCTDCADKKVKRYEWKLERRKGGAGSRKRTATKAASKAQAKAKAAKPKRARKAATKKAAAKARPAAKKAAKPRKARKAKAAAAAKPEATSAEPF